MSNPITRVAIGAALALVVSSVGLAADLLSRSIPPAVATSEGGPTLYERLGGEAVVRRIADEVIGSAARDPKLARSFEDVNVERVKRLLAEQICELTGGGCRYSGDSMKDSHAGLGLTEREFFGLVEVLRESMRRNGVGLRERNELLAILAPMKRDVVER